MKTIKCPDCAAKVRPCNLERHRRSHLPIAKSTWWGVEFLPPRRPLLQMKHDTRYDEVAPRGYGETRFRLYRLRGGLLEMLGAVKDPEMIGLALVDFYYRHLFIADDAHGILDTTSEPGAWIVHPWALGRTRRAA